MDKGLLSSEEELIEFQITAIYGVELSIEPSDYGWHKHEEGNYHRLITEVNYNGQEDLVGQVIIHEEKLFPILCENIVNIDRVYERTIYFDIVDQKKLEALRKITFIGVYAGDFEIINHPNAEEYQDSFIENHTFYLLSIEK